MTAIQKPMLVALKKILQERYVPYLPSLIDNTNSSEATKEKQISRAFSAFVLQTLFELSSKNAARSIVDDFEDNGIDAIYHAKNEDNELDTIYLLQSKLKETEQFGQDEALKFCKGIKQLLDYEFSAFNINIKNRENEIKEALDNCSHIKIIVAYVGDGISKHATDALEHLIADVRQDDERLSQEVIYFTPLKVENALRSEKACKPINKVKISFSSMKKIEEPRTTLFGMVHINDLINLHQAHNKSLYEKNIRFFIGAGRQGVNRAIKSTLEHNPQDFFYLNNGVTAIASRISKKGKDLCVLDGFSIINGAQTVASAAQFLEEHPQHDISQAKVMLTIIKAYETGDFHKKVTRARNLQNPVDISSFAALDDIQERLKQEMALFGVEYRYRPELQEADSSFVIKIEELAKALACLDKFNRTPYDLKYNATQFIDVESEKYKSIFAQDLSGCKAINAVRSFRVISSLLNKAELTSRSPEKLIYRHSLYVIAFILLKKLKDRICGKDIMSVSDIQKLVSIDFDQLRQDCFDIYQKSYAYNAPHSFFKKLDTCAYINKVLIQHQNMENDQNVLNLQGKYDKQNPQNQKLTNYLIGKVQQI